MLDVGSKHRVLSPGGRKSVVVLAFVVNLGILAVYKYHGFFIDNAIALMNAVGIHASPWTLRLMLPVGISFYTFQALGYVLDVYRGEVRPTRDAVAFFAFVSFFPQLVAGPIERARNLLPQFLCARHFDYASAVEGCRQMLWGFFKKVVVADACAGAVETTLGNPLATGLYIWMGVIFFAFQIYCDFSGYSDIAIGCSKLFGIRLSQNFRMPYFSRDIAEFWRRWHISLTTWFRDYLYIPMGGSRCSFAKAARNTFIVFVVSGFWHGPSWCFICWGVFHAVCFLPLLYFGKNRRYVCGRVAEGRILPSVREAMQMGCTFLIVLLGWVFFRAPDIETAFDWFLRMFGFSGVLASVTSCEAGASGNLAAVDPSLQTAAVGLDVSGVWLEKTFDILLPILVLVTLEWFNRGRDIPRLPARKWLRWCVYLGLILLLVAKCGKSSEFIYFQF